MADFEQFYYNYQPLPKTCRIVSKTVSYTEFVLSNAFPIFIRFTIMEMDGPTFKTQAVLFEHCNQQSVDTYPVKLRYKEDPFNFKYCLRSEF